MFTEFMQSCLGKDPVETSEVDTRVLFATHQEIVSANYVEVRKKYNEKKQ
jgi:hypothetical protein